MRDALESILAIVKGNCDRLDAAEIRTICERALATIRESSSLVSQCAESADIGKLDGVDEAGVKMGKVKCPKCLQEIDSYFEDRVYGRVRVFIGAGSAETGGEK